MRIRMGEHSMVDRRVPLATQAFYSELLPKVVHQLCR